MNLLDTQIPMEPYIGKSNYSIQGGGAQLFCMRQHRTLLWEKRT